MGCLVFDYNVVLKQVILGDPWTIFIGHCHPGTNNDTSAEKALQQVCSPQYVHCIAFHEKMCIKRYSYCVNKAPVITDTQVEQFGNFVKNVRTTSQH